MRLVGRVVAHDGEHDLPRRQVLETFLLAEHLAVGRENRFDPHQVELGDAGGAQRQLEGRQLLAMTSDAFSQECSFWDRPHLLPLRIVADIAALSLVPQSIRDAGELASRRFRVISYTNSPAGRYTV